MSWLKIGSRESRRLERAFREAVANPTNHRLTVLPPSDIQQLAAAVKRLTEQVAGLRTDLDRHFDRRDEHRQ